MIGHLNTYNMQQGQQVGLVAMIVETQNASIRSLEPAAVRSLALKDVIASATMAITLPDGTDEEVPMFDDGLHGDFEADDGVYGGLIQATEVGTYQAQAILQGKLDNGVPFFRTTQHLIASTPDELTLVGSATATYSDSEHLVISLPVTENSIIYDLDETFRGYAEVWGIDSNGNAAPACWIAGLTQINAGQINLVLNVNWLSYAGVSLPLTLKNVLVQDGDTFVPLSTSTSIPVTVDSATQATIISSLAGRNVVTITTEMKQGDLPEYYQSKKGVNAGNGAIILVHGYCSGTNPWSAYPNDWTNAYYFLDAGASTTNEKFALKVLSYAQQQGISDRFVVVGHSQGGLVSAHILNYLFSGMDNVGAGLKIQSVGTPYEGCTAAGSAANLGEAFGVGCGTNFDLSIDGARIWLPGITQDTRSEINYYTTSYKLNTFFGDSCSMAMNMILEWPNDGTSELEYTDPAGAKNMGNTQQQCHTTDMNYPAQYYDNARNKRMNAAAAR